MSKSFRPEIRKFLAPEFITGADTRMLAGQYLQNLGVSNVLIASDKTIITQKWYKDIIESINELGIEYHTYSSISPNPHDEEVMQGSSFYVDNECDGILAIGGGSVIDCAKGIGIISTNGGHILDYEGVDEVKSAMPPLICIPSTSGTSADVSQFSIIRDMNRKIKIAIISKAIVPDVALIDPVATYSMDKYLTICTGIDALSHAFEAFVSNSGSVITDNHAMHAISLLKDNLPLIYSDLHNIEARYNLVIASLEAGLAFSNASLGAVHAMSHSLGGYYDYAHGECNALLLDHVVNYNFDFAVEKYKKIGEMFNLDFRGLSTSESRNRLFNHLNSFKLSLGIDNTLQTLGTKRDELIILSKFASKDPCLLTNPKEMNKDDINTVFREAL